MEDQSFEPDPPSEDEIRDAYELKYFGVEHDAS